MLQYLIRFCVRWPLAVVIATLLFTAAGVYLTVTRFAIDTDTNNLFSSQIPWRQNEAKLYKEFPNLENLIVGVIDGETPEKADEAAQKLAKALNGAPMILRSWRPDENEFFRTHGLLYLDLKALRKITGTLIAQKEILQPLAEDESLRGLTSALVDNMRQIGGDQSGMERFTAGLDQFTQAFEATVMGEPAEVDWEKLLSLGDAEEEPATAKEKRRIVLIKPVLDYSALQPGAQAIEEVRRTAASLGIGAGGGATLRLTGQAPLEDDEFSTISENMTFNLSATLAIIALILFAALRSPKLIFAVLATLLAGLAMTAGVGILMIGRFNMISVAFAALFIGLGVDFGIQFATRYREERHKAQNSTNGVDEALINAGGNIGGALTLAAVSLLAGFFCFLPTDFKGVAELGLIAGCGMIVAYVATLTFLPALIKLLHPRAETRPVETASLAGVDHWIAGHRAVVIVGAVLLTAGGAPFLRHLTFDSNPMDLRNQKVELVKTFLDLSKNPKTAPNTIDVMEPSLQAAQAVAEKLRALPVVDHVVDVETLLPKDQDAKLPLLQNAAFQLRHVFEPKKKTPPTDAENKASLQMTAMAMTRASGGHAPPSLSRFIEALQALAQGDEDLRRRATIAVFAGFDKTIKDLRQAVSVGRVTIDNLPEDLSRDWISPSGQYRVEAAAKGDSNDREVMADFGSEVQKIAPEASGPPIVVSAAGKTVVRAFLMAGLYAFIAIFAILAFALRNAKDVALTLGPLVLAGILSLETADALGMSLNFANIIALPLMFAVGVAFHIYYVIAWRKGVADMLASSLTRAIFFSSLTTGTAFGSLIFSSHPGTASMGELLAISLFFTLVAAFIVVPAFLGPPRTQQVPAPVGGALEEGRAQS